MNSGTDLLKKLASGVLPRGVGETPGVLGRANLAGGGFGELLAAAGKGALASGRAVTEEKGSGLTLTDEQRAKLGEAADRAEASGATRALVQVGGSWFKVDLGARTVSAAAEPRAGEVLTGIDAVIRETPEAKAEGPTGGQLLKKLGAMAR